MSVALVGFDYEIFDSLFHQGIPINVLVYDHRRPAKVVDGVTYIPHDDVHHMFDGAFAANLDPEIVKQVQDKALRLFERTHYRTFIRRTFEGYDFRNVQNHFHNALQFYWNLIDKHDLKQIVFRNVPHGGSTIILYFLAKAMGVQTIILTQSIWPNAFWAADAIEDVGVAGFNAGQRKEIQIESSPAIPFYMKGAGQKPDSWFRYMTVRQWGNYFFKTLVGLHLFNKKSVSKTAAKLKWLKQERALQRRVTAIAEPYLPDRQFVYFPLHLQPEMTTDILGGIYADQLRAIEELARELPDNVYIYVKENPKQSAFMRDESFFIRLKAIPRVVFVDITTPSLQMIDDAIAVATITGTAGWEAIQMGKPVLIFGTAFYRALPGAIDWRTRPVDLMAAIQEHQPDPDGLRAGVDAKSTLLWPGVLQNEYAAIVPNFDRAQNMISVTQSIKDILAV